MMINNELILKILDSWSRKDGELYSNQELLNWISELNENVFVKIKKIKFKEMKSWKYLPEHNGLVKDDLSFFQIKGVRETEAGVVKEQPIIIQNEIGYLGIICKEIGGILYFLMQAKIEPGNINTVQISPTLQATKSNFMQAHGGKIPLYLEYFDKADEHEIIVDQIQSEQSSRFFKKRNRNIIIKINNDIKISPNYRWMTLGQIKELMKIDNLVNMDTRTVISCIPFSMKKYSEAELKNIKRYFKKEALFNSIFNGNEGANINKVYQYINNIKMLNQKKIDIIDINDLNEWKFEEDQISKKNGKFKVVFCDIEIEGREVKKWQQPLIEAEEEAVFGLIYCIYNNKMLFLTQVISEIGCFDIVEIGPSVQTFSKEPYKNIIEKLFFEKMEAQNGIIFSGLFSEEGGRFYHEQNRNVIMEIDCHEIPNLPQGYFWLDYQTLNILVQINNCLNIQLRNLLSIIDL